MDLIKEEQEMLDIVLKLDPEQRYAYIDKNWEALMPSVPNVPEKCDALKRVLKKFLEDRGLLSDFEVELTTKDLEAINNVVGYQNKKIFYSLLCWYKANYHESGWVKFHYPKCLRCAFNKEDAKNVPISCFSGLKKYGFDMRVVGSKNPTLCFKVPYNKDEVRYKLKGDEIKNRCEEILESASF